jgi:hypothetical protein
MNHTEEFRETQALVITESQGTVSPEGADTSAAEDAHDSGYAMTVADCVDSMEESDNVSLVMKPTCPIEYPMNPGWERNSPIVPDGEDTRHTNTLPHTGEDKLAQPPMKTHSVGPSIDKLFDHNRRDARNVRRAMHNGNECGEPELGSWVASRCCDDNLNRLGLPVI